MLTKTMNTMAAPAAFFVPMTPPLGFLHGDDSVLGTSAQSRTAVVDCMIADGVEGVLPRGVPD